MRIWLKRIGLGLVIFLVAAQLVPINRTNPVVDPAKTIYAAYPVPLQVRSVFQKSCVDCHSNQTVWPWYSYVAPVSWVVAYDVQEGRTRMNLSEWANRSKDEREDKLAQMCDELVHDDMPDVKYLWIHHNARPTQEEKDALCAWVETVRNQP